MSTTETAIVGQYIKTGRTGTKPQILEVIWTGTAEATVYDMARIPAALVDTNRGPMLVLRLAGCDKERDAWWDARCLTSREWEAEDGTLIGDADPAIAAQIDEILASATERHDESCKDLHDRVRRGTYAIALTGEDR